ncbi:MAG: hypothetical protein APF80_16710 [Alphaproteobacteria bacterium BRH_c36]|nr:MAG: hypothetical protein APF80_16710 [Alphaproteobacteria bacterium BRH_c36]
MAFTVYVACDGATLIIARWQRRIDYDGGGLSDHLLKMKADRLDAQGTPEIASGHSYALVSGRLLSIARLLVFLSPTVLAVLYFGLIAAERYVAEASFVVRTPAQQASGLGFGALLQATGLGRSQDEVYSVQAYMKSRTAARELREQISINTVYNRPEADALARYPSFLYGPSLEELYEYLQWMIDVTHDSTTGITTLTVQAFRPKDAQQVALLLLELGEKKVNDLNSRVRNDAVKLAEDEVDRAEKRLVAVQVAITQFRNHETTIDPASSLLVLTELMARLRASLTQTEAQIREVSSAAETNPQLPSLRRRAEALRQQITIERERISAGPGGLADKLAIYERLVLDREFAKQALEAAAKSLESALVEARRKQLYLERIVEPLAADRSTAPERLRHIVAAFGLNILALLIGWLVYAGFREHTVQHNA